VPEDTSGGLPLWPELIRVRRVTERLGMTRQTAANRLRWPTAAALLVAAAAHVPVIPEHLHEAPYMGLLFVGFTAVAAALAVVVTVRGSAPAPFLAAGALCAVAIATYCLTRLVAFPQLGDDVGNWGEPLGVLSIASEVAVVLLSAAAGMLRAPRSPHRSGRLA
jgi:cytochrome bd-type quinol oxidase subunit 2